MEQSTEDIVASVPPREGSVYRAFLGLAALTAGVLGLLGLFTVSVPPGNKDPLLLALGIVLGWGSTVVNYEFGSSPAGRKAADIGISAAQAAVPTAAEETENKDG